MGSKLPRRMNYKRKPNAKYKQVEERLVEGNERNMENDTKESNLDEATTGLKLFLTILIKINYAYLDDLHLHYLTQN